MEKVDVVLPAGGRIAGDFAAEAGAELKALIPLGGRTVLERMLAALRATGRVGRIVIVGPSEVASHPAARAADAVLPEGGTTGPANILRGLEWLRDASGGQQAERVLIVTTDLPFLTPEAITSFLDACPSELEACVPVIRRDEFEARFPGSSGFYVRLRDGQWAVGCTFLVNPATIIRNRSHLEGAFAARKSPVTMARLLGPLFIIRFLARRLTVGQVEQRCLEILGCTGRGMRGCAPELAFDIDRPEDYRYAAKDLDSNDETSATREAAAEGQTSESLPKEAMTYPKQTASLYFNLSVFWFALAFLWAGMITIVMQTLVKEMTGPQKDLYLGWTLALGALISTVVVIIVGTLSDRSRWKMGKRRPYMIIGSILSVPALLWLARVGSIPLLILDFCLIQFWVNVATSPYQALMPDMVPKQRQGTASAYLGMTSLIGQLGGLILCGLLITKAGGLSTIMVTLSALLVATMLYTVVRVPERSAADNPAQRVGFFEAVVESFRVNPREHPDFFRLIISRFIINMGFYTATEFLLYYVSDTLRAPRPVDTVTQIFVISTVSGLLGNFPAGILSDRVSKKTVVYISSAITGVAALVFLLTSSIAVALGAAFIFGAGFGSFMAVDWAFATNLLPDRDEAKHMGIWHVAFTVPQVIAPFVGGLVAYFFNQHVGQGFGYRVVLFLVIVYLAVGTTVIRPIKERVIPKE
jgi:MFS family permease/GTP:adenosylcobinamide-phosphate guanylyltransferase